MATITGEEIKKLIYRFTKRKVKFYHSCQYKDFKTYLKLGYIGSRNLLEFNNLEFTKFNTDSVDKENAVWDKIFGNLSDFGNGFALGKKNENTAPVPNPYGSILLVYKPAVFTEAKDIAICLHSAGGKGFNRDNESLPNTEEVDKIFKESFKYRLGTNDISQSFIKSSSELIDTFSLNPHQTANPEVSMIITNETLSLTIVR